MNQDTMSISSLHFRTNNKAPMWVDHLLGAKSVFWQMDEMSRERKILNTLDEGRESILSHAASPPAVSMTPSCSLELLGFVRVDAAEPFLLQDKHRHPSLGTGKLLLGSNNSSWSCYYRATYDNWRMTEYVGKDPFYWPVFFYCPASSALACHRDVIDKMDRKRELNLSLYLNVTTRMGKKEDWSVNLTMIMNPRIWDPPEAMQTVPDLAVCSSMPYRSNQPAKQESIHAILLEWIRYHTALDIRTVLYDATGSQFDAMQRSAYYQKQAIPPATLRRIWERFEYHDYSILSLLYPQLRNMTYDNLDGLNSVIMKLDDDHTYTLTHCRFDVEARHGIQNILVADFDEFLYFPHAGSHGRLQAHYLRESLLHEAKRRSFDQILLWQFLLGSRLPQDDVAECVAREAKGESQAPSIYNCFAFFSAYASSVQLYKSIHLTKACPFNTDHHACTTTTMSRMEDYDCLCDTKAVFQCVLVHLSLRPNDYKGRQPLRSANSSESGPDRTKFNRTELSRVVRYEMVARPRTTLKIF